MGEIMRHKILECLFNKTAEFLSNKTNLIIIFIVGLMVISFLLYVCKASDQFRNAALILTGYFALCIAIWRGVIANKQEETSRKQEQISRNSHEAGLLEKSVKLLSSEHLYERIGGLQALSDFSDNESLKIKSNDDNRLISIINIICTFIKEHPYKAKQNEMNSAWKSIEEIMDGKYDANHAGSPKYYENEKLYSFYFRKLRTFLNNEPEVDFNKVREFLSISCPDINFALQTLEKIRRNDEINSYLIDREENYYDLSKTCFNFMLLENVNYFHTNLKGAQFLDTQFINTHFDTCVLDSLEFKFRFVKRGQTQPTTIIDSSFNKCFIQNIQFLSGGRIRRDGFSKKFENNWCFHRPIDEHVKDNHFIFKLYQSCKIYKSKPEYNPLVTIKNFILPNFDNNDLWLNNEEKQTLNKEVKDHIYDEESDTVKKV